jgi:Leucine rich repeat
VLECLKLEIMKLQRVLIVLIFWSLRDAAFGQSRQGYSTFTTIIKNADLVGDNEIDTGNFSILRFRNSFDLPGVIDEEHERFVFIKVKSIDDFIMNQTYNLPDSQIYAKTYFWSPWWYSETNKIAGTITRIEKNDTAELFQINLKCVNNEGKIDTLVWSNYLFKYDVNYFESNKVEYNGEYDNLRIALKEPLKVKKLDLSYKGIWKYQKNLSGKQELPSEIGAFKNLEDFNLSLQSLKGLPTEFSQLTKLKNLDISYNNFESFPVQIFFCQDLDSLNLKLSYISEIPGEISKLSNLKKLVLDDNWLNGFPLAVTSLTELRELSITNGNIKVIPKEIGRLTKLEKLDLSNFWNYERKNVCDSLSNLAQLSNLKVLNLEWTKIKSLPTEFSQLKKLEVLNIKFNDFKSFPEVIDQIPNLKLLIIWHEEFDKKTMKELKRQNKKYKVQIDYL